jgi:hypothetical protein
MEEPRTVQDRSKRVNHVLHASNQCYGSMTFGVDPDPDARIHAVCLMDPEPDADSDPAIFVFNLQVANKELFFIKSSSAYYFLKVHKKNIFLLKVLLLITF